MAYSLLKRTAIGITTSNKAFVTVTCVLLLTTFLPKAVQAQTLSVTSLNNSSNGVTITDTLIRSRKNIAVFGFAINVTGSAAEVFQLNITTSANSSAYFQNGRLYRSTDAIYGNGDETLVQTLPAGSWFGSNVQITNLTEAFAVNTTKYYFLVADFDKTNGQNTLPQPMQFRFVSGQSPYTAVILKSYLRTYNTFNINGPSYVLSEPKYTMASANDPSTNGVSAGPLIQGQTGYVLFGYELTVKGITTISEFHIASTNSASGNYFQNGKLYRSSTPKFSDASPVTASVAFSGSKVDITGLSETVFNDAVNGKKYWYFLVGDYTVNGGDPSQSIQFKFYPNQPASYPALKQSSPYNLVYNNFTVDGRTYNFVALKHWRGYGSSDFNTPGNWDGAVLPTENEIVYIGQQDFTNPPIITRDITIGGIIFGSTRAADLTVSTRATLMVNGDISLPKASSDIARKLTGEGTIVANNIKIGDAVNPLSNSTAALTADIANLHVRNNITITSTANINNRNDASFLLSSGNVLIEGSIQSISGSGNNSTFSLNTGSKRANLTFTGSNPLITSGIGSHTIEFTGTSGTVSFSGNDQQIPALSYPKLILTGTQNCVKTINSGNLRIEGVFNILSPATLSYTDSHNTTIDINGDLEGDAFINSGNIPITISGNWNNSATGYIGAGSNVTYDGESSQIVSTGINYHHLNLSGTGTKTISSGILKINGNLDLSLSGSPAYNSTSAIDIDGDLTGNKFINSGNIPVSIGRHWTNSAGGTLTGTVTYDGTDQNVSTAVTYQDLTLAGSGVKTIGANTLAVLGDLTLVKPTAPLTLTLAGSPTTVIDVNGDLEGNALFSSGSVPLNLAGNWNNTAPGTVTGLVTYDKAGNQMVGPVNYTNVTFKNGGIKEIITDMATVSENLDVQAGTVLKTNGRLKLLASDGKNAHVKALSGGADINGLVTVQVLVRGRTRWQPMFSAPVWDRTNGDGTKAFTYAQLKNDLIVTGVTGATGGFDVGSGTSRTATIRYFNEPKFMTPSNINESINAGKGFQFFFRGNRSNMDSKLYGGVSAPAPEDVTMEYVGYINKGDITQNLSYLTSSSPENKGYNMLGNPYPSVINFELLTKPASIDKVWIATKTGFFAIWDQTNQLSTNGGSKFIPPGQGFWVQAATSGTSLTFTESSKVTNVNTEFPPVRFMTAKSSKMMSASAPVITSSAAIPHVRLAMKQGDVTDETVVAFKEGSDRNKAGEDAGYMGDGKFGFNSLSADNQKLAINLLPVANEDMEVKLNVTALASGDYSLSLTDFSLNNRDIFLEDRFANRVVDMRINPDYSFSIDKSQSASFGSDRFKMIFKLPKTLPISLLGFSAKRVANGAELKWVTAAEKNNDYFVVERSVDGKDYAMVAQVKAVGNASSNSNYSCLDRNPINGVNYYRLKQVDTNGKFSFSDVISLNYSVTDGDMVFTVFPNPTSDVIRVNLKESRDNIVVKVFDLTGKMLKSVSVSNAATVEQNVADLIKGTYIIQVADAKTNSVIGKDMFIKE